MENIDRGRLERCVSKVTDQIMLVIKLRSRNYHKKESGKYKITNVAAESR